MLPSYNIGVENQHPVTKRWAATLRNGDYSSPGVSQHGSRTGSRRQSRAPSHAASRTTSTVNSKVTSRVPSKVPSENNSRSSKRNSLVTSRTQSTVTSGRNSPNRKNSTSSIYKPSEKTKLMKKNSKKLRDFAEKRDLLKPKNSQLNDVNATSISKKPVSENPTPENVNREVNIKLAQEQLNYHNDALTELCNKRLKIPDESQQINEENLQLESEEVVERRKRIEEIKAATIARKLNNSGISSTAAQVNGDINRENGALESSVVDPIESEENTIDIFAENSTPSNLSDAKIEVTKDIEVSDRKKRIDEIRAKLAKK